MLDTVDSVVTSDHSITHCVTEDELAEQILDARCGVALIDIAAVTDSPAELTRRLRQQFPDLVLVVAGLAEHQAALAAQIASGEIYRFLHKPVSAQRVRLFIEAALRRHDEEHAGIAAAPVRPAERAPRATGPKRGNSPPLAATGAVIAVVAAGIGWFALRDDDPPPAAAADTPASADAASVTERLKQADAAFERGELLTPAATSAATLYQQVLASDPNDPRALAGMDRVVNSVLTSAEQSILAGRLDAASASVEAARKLQPDNVRIEFLNAQIGKERERALLARARTAAASGNLGAAIAVLDGASSPAGGDSLLSETRRSLEQQQVGERLRTLLRQAGERLQRGALIDRPPTMPSSTSKARGLSRRATPQCCASPNSSTTACWARRARQPGAVTRRPPSAGCGRPPMPASKRATSPRFACSSPRRRMRRSPARARASAR